MVPTVLPGVTSFLFPLRKKSDKVTVWGRLSYKLGYSTYIGILGRKFFSPDGWGNLEMLM